MDNLSAEPSEADILKRISAARRGVPVEPEQGQPEGNDDELEAVEAGDDGEESESLEPESGESEESDEIEYYLIDGEEVPVSKIKEWQSGHLMQSDYTRKTQALAEERRTIESAKEETANLKSKLEQLVSQLEGSLDDPTELAELREYDPAAYLDRIEKMQAKKAKLEEAKKLTSQQQEREHSERVAREMSQFVASNPKWLDSNGKPTDAYKADTELMNSYLAAQQWTPEEINNIKSAKMMQLILDASKAHALKSRGDATAKKVKQAPKVTKPTTGGQQSGLERQIADAQAKLKRTGSERDAMALLKLKKKLRGN